LQGKQTAQGVGHGQGVGGGLVAKHMEKLVKLFGRIEGQIDEKNLLPAQHAIASARAAER
jgi:hypothetical protein